MEVEFVKERAKVPYGNLCYGALFRLDPVSRPCMKTTKGAIILSGPNTGLFTEIYASVLVEHLRQVEPLKLEAY